MIGNDTFEYIEEFREEIEQPSTMELSSQEPDLPTTLVQTENPIQNPSETFSTSNPLPPIDSEPTIPTTPDPVSSKLIFPSRNHIN